MRRHTAAPRAGFQFSLYGLLTLLAATPAFAGDGDEGVVKLTDRAPRATANSDAAVTPAGLLTGTAASDGGVCCEGGACNGGACNGGARGAGLNGNGSCGDGSCGAGNCRTCGPTFTLPGRCPLADRGLCCPKCGTRCGPGGTCNACGAAGVPCGGPGLCLPGVLGLPGVCLPGVPGACLPGTCLPGTCLPGTCLPGLLPPGIPYWAADGGPQSCYLCSLLGVGANACDGRHGLFGRYDQVYAVNPGYSDRREGNVWAAAATGVPTAVPLAPNVRHTMEYGWGMPSSRLVPISRPAPPSYLYGPPAGTAVELPRTRGGRIQSLPIIPELGQGALHDHRTGTAFERHGSVQAEL